MTRSEIIQLIEETIFANNAKLVKAQAHQDMLKELAGSYFNTDSDNVEDLNYSSGQTMQQLVSILMGSAPLWGLTGMFPFGGGSAPITGNSGIIQSAAKTQVTDRDIKVTIQFDQPINDRKIVTNIFTDSPDVNGNNDLGTPVVRVHATNGIEVGLRLTSGGVITTGIRIQCLLFTNQ